jgi:hypothetical protein
MIWRKCAGERDAGAYRRMGRLDQCEGPTDAGSEDPTPFFSDEGLLDQVVKCGRDIAQILWIEAVVLHDGRLIEQGGKADRARADPSLGICGWSNPNGTTPRQTTTPGWGPGLGGRYRSPLPFPKGVVKVICWRTGGLVSQSTGREGNMGRTFRKISHFLQPRGQSA